MRIASLPLDSRAQFTSKAIADKQFETETAEFALSKAGGNAKDGRMRVSSYWLIITSFLLAAATKPLLAQAPNGRPVPVSVSPAYGNGSEQTFQFLWEDPDGFEDL